MIFCNRIQSITHYDGKHRKYSGFEIGWRNAHEFPLFKIEFTWFVGEEVPANHWSKIVNVP